MKVKGCERCEYYRRKTWSHEYKPNGYHAIGMTHAYAYCEKKGMRISNIKQCEVKNDKG